MAGLASIHNKKSVRLLLVAFCVLIGFAAMLGGQRLAFADGNAWQIVDRAYDPAHITSQGISDSDLDKYNFVKSDDGSDDSQVHVTKTVEQTGVEDEFIVHLSVDTSATSKQVTDYYTFFVNAPYEATTSNGYHDYPEGSVTSDQKGTMDVKVSGKTDLGGNKGVFNIYDPQKRIIAENVTLYWSQANNVTILLNIGELLGVGDEYIIMGTKVSKDSKNDLYLTQEAYDLVNKAIQGATKWGDPTRLSSVIDFMGDDVEYIGGASADGGSVSYNSATRAITWNPTYSSSCTKGEITTEVDTETNQYGAVTKVTVTQRQWYYGAASLSYKVRLNTQAADFKSSYDPGSVTSAFGTNKAATLRYSYSVDGGETYKDNSVDFLKPTAKGILYDLQALKTNEISTPLAGAIFKLTRSWTDSFGVGHTDLISDNLVSDADGYVKYGSLPWGIYTLEETAAPSGHNLPLSPKNKVTFNLCYSSNSDVLVPSTLGIGANHAMASGAVPVIENERVKTDVTLLKVDADTNAPLQGAKFALYKDDGDGSFKEADDLTDANKVAELETGSDGKAVFEKLTVGTYYLKETYTPAGYELNSKVYRIDVFDVKGAAGGADDNMIRVGDADGSNMQPPNTANQITVADRPIPDLPIAGSSGVYGSMGYGLALLCIGAALAMISGLRSRLSVRGAKHRMI